MPGNMRRIASVMDRGANEGQVNDAMQTQQRERIADRRLGTCLSIIKRPRFSQRSLIG